MSARFQTSSPPLSRSRFRSTRTPSGLRRLPKATLSSDEDEGTLVFFSTVGDDYFEILETPLVHGRSFDVHDERGVAAGRDRERDAGAALLAGRERHRQAIRRRKRRRSLGSRGRRSRRQVPHARRGASALLLPAASPELSLSVDPRRENPLGPSTSRARGSGDRALPRSRAPRCTGSRPWESFWTARRPRSGRSRSSLRSSPPLRLTLATVGLYSLMSFTVSQRRHELGIRTALGASRGRVLALFIGQAARVAGVGIAIGLALAWASTRVMGNLLFGVEHRKPGDLRRRVDSPGRRGTCRELRSRPARHPARLR